MHVQIFCLANINLLLFNCSRCRDRRRYALLKLPIVVIQKFATMVT